MSEVATKRCVDCKLVLPRTEFYRVRKDSPMRQHRCKNCDNKRRTARLPSSENRVQRKVCSLCFGLPHRVEGKRCERCGLEFAEEKMAQ